MRVLHVIHDFLPRHRAGSELYAAALATAQAERGLETHVLCAEMDLQRPHGSLTWRSHGDVPVTELVNNWLFDSFTESWSSPRLNTALEHVLRAVRPDVLHVHSLQNLSFDLPALARRLGIPAVATLHDYTLLCPSGGQLVHLAEEHVCTSIDPARCARCFPASPQATQATVARLGQRLGVAVALGRLARSALRWFPSLANGLARAVSRRAGSSLGAAEISYRLDAARAAVAAIELLVAPSRSLADSMLRLGLPEARIEVSDYGFPPLPEVPRTASDGRLRLGFVGTLVWHKGLHVLVASLRHLPGDRLELLVHGSADTAPAYATSLRQAAAALPVRFLGGFDRERVADIYAGIDVLVVPSLWPENSPLVIHEAFQAGVPVVAARGGGIVDLVEDGVSGLLYEPFSAESLAAALRRILDEPGLLASLVSGRPRVKSIAEDAGEWGERYRRVLASWSRR